LRIGDYFRVRRLLLVFFCSPLLGREREKVEKAEMAQLWIDFVVVVHEKNKLSTEVFHSNIPITLKRALTPTMMGRFEKAIQPPLLKE